MLRFHLSSVAFLLDLQLKLIIKVVVWSRAAEVWRVCRRSIRNQQKQADKDRTDVTVRHRDTWSIQHLTEGNRMRSDWQLINSDGLFAQSERLYKHIHNMFIYQKLIFRPTHSFTHTHAEVFLHSGHVASRHDPSITESIHPAGFLIAWNQSEASRLALRLQSQLTLITADIKGFRAAAFKPPATARPHPQPFDLITFNSSTAAHQRRVFLPWRSNAACSFSPWSIQIKRLQRRADPLLRYKDALL